MALNRITLEGRLVADPELRHTQGGTAATSFRLAVDRDFKDRDTGERKADFINIIAWRGTAEQAAKYLHKGSMATVDGRLQIRDYTDRDGVRKFVAEVVADRVYYTGGSRSSEDAGENRNNHGGSYGVPNVSAEDFRDITDEDDSELPF